MNKIVLKDEQIGCLASKFHENNGEQIVVYCYQEESRFVFAPEFVFDDYCFFIKLPDMDEYTDGIYIIKFDEPVKFDDEFANEIARKYQGNKENIIKFWWGEIKTPFEGI